MLSKLLKYDFKALFRYLFPCIYCILGASVLGSVMLTVFIRSIEKQSPRGSFFPIVEIFSILIFVFMMLILLGAIYAVAICLLVHFYKNLMSNEGYLTFTLPVKNSTLLMSKIISAFTCLLIGAAALIVGIFIVLLFGSASSGIINTEICASIGNLFGMLFRDFGFYEFFIVFEIIIAAIVLPVSTILIYYNAIILGGIVATKYKLAAAIGFIFVFNFVISAVFQVLTQILVLTANSIALILAILIIILAAVGLLCYFWSLNLLNKKLNL